MLLHRDVVHALEQSSLKDRIVLSSSCDHDGVNGKMDGGSGEKRKEKREERMSG